MARNDDAERYRQAAYLALDQLEWCANYFRSIRKTRLSTLVAKNRATIAGRLRDQPTGAHAHNRR
jgi:hypothetical protein